MRAWGCWAPSSSSWGRAGPWGDASSRGQPHLGLAGALQQLVGQGGPLGGCVQQHAEAAVGEHGREHVGAPDAAPLDKYLRQ